MIGAGFGATSSTKAGHPSITDSRSGRTIFVPGKRARGMDSFSRSTLGSKYCTSFGGGFAAGRRKATTFPCPFDACPLPFCLGGLLLGGLGLIESKGLLIVFSLKRWQ